MSRFYPGTLANQQTMINKLDALARQSMALDACHYANQRFTSGTGVALRWSDPKDNVIQGFTAATWARTVIVRKEDSDPTSPTDGTVVITTTVRNQYLNSAYVDASGTANSHYRAFPYSTAGAYNDSADNIFKAYTLFSYTIDESNSDEATCVEYGDDCVNFTPLAMDFENNVLATNSWYNPVTKTGAFFMPKPCMLHRADADHGEAYVDYYLDDNDYTKKADGITASDVSNTAYNGNAMMEFPRVFFKTSKVGALIKVWISDTKLDSGFECWNCKREDGTYAEHFYLPIYEGVILNNTLRSISTGNKPNGGTASSEWSGAVANNLLNDQGWGTTLWADEQIMKVLGYLVFKRLNSQKAIGGNFNTANSLQMNCGAGNTYGLFYGKYDGSYTTCKFFGMENWWGHRWRRAQGIIAIDYRLKAKMTLSNVDGSTGSIITTDTAGDYSGYLDTGCTLPSGTGSYITRSWNDPLAMFMPMLAAGGSSDTYYCDGMYSSAGTRGWVCGGVVSSGLVSGLASLSAAYAPSTATWHYGASLSYHHF